MFRFPNWPSMGDKARPLEPDPVPVEAIKPASPTGPSITIQRPSWPDQVLPYTPGASLRQYFQLAGLTATVMSHSVHDLTNLPHGRCRSYYVPQAGAVIRLGNPNVGIQGHLQHQTRGRQDLDEVVLTPKPTEPETRNPDVFRDIDQI